MPGFLLEYCVLLEYVDSCWASLSCWNTGALAGKHDLAGIPGLLLDSVVLLEYLPLLENIILLEYLDSCWTPLSCWNT